MTLRVNGYETALCRDGKEAFQLMRENRHSLVVLDVMLPGMDGFTIVESLINEGR